MKNWHKKLLTKVIVQAAVMRRLKGSVSESSDGRSSAIEVCLNMVIQN